MVRAGPAKPLQTPGVPPRLRWQRAVLLGGLALAACACSPERPTPWQPLLPSALAAENTTGGDPRLGRQAIQRYGCGACHAIPGVPGARGAVGPPLGGIASRQVIAGRLPNMPENLMRWIQHPQAVEPGNVMPELGVSAADARDIAAYLDTLK
ncbi:MAG TPA: c-type cytochrome [Chloroflexota bacterium]|nr:c-type cytochrome [Chloroflexota bacterium]